MLGLCGPCLFDAEHIICMLCIVCIVFFVLFSRVFLCFCYTMYSVVLRVYLNVVSMCMSMVCIRVGD